MISDYLSPKGRTPCAPTEKIIAWQGDFVN